MNKLVLHGCKDTMRYDLTYHDIDIYHTNLEEHVKNITIIFPSYQWISGSG